MQSQHQLLVIDSDLEVCTTLRDVGENCGYNTAITNTANDFITQYNQINPTFIILSLKIADSDGIEVMRFLAQNHCICPIIIESAQDKRVITVSMKLGQDMGLNVIKFFKRPFDVKELADILNQYKESKVLNTAMVIKEAIERGQYNMYYQPKVSFKTCEVVGVEALVRMVTNGELSSSKDLVTLAEETNLIRHLTDSVMCKSLNDFKDLINIYPKLSLSINLSSKIFDDLNIPDQFIKVFDNFEIEPSKVCFEITETAFTRNHSIIADIITRFRIKGFRLSIDDFGTGYSSLVELHTLPFNEIKIDPSFIKELGVSLDAQQISQSVINLGHNIGMEVTAVGVENKAAWDILKDQECDIAQGYYISPALGIDDLKKWLKENLLWLKCS